MEENLGYARVERSQLMAKLREANVSQLKQVHAVVLESTGDISVLYAENDAGNQYVDRAILEGVRERP